MTAHTWDPHRHFVRVGLDYYRGIHERALAATPVGHLMPPNPAITMVSVDCGHLRITADLILGEIDIADVLPRKRTNAS